jgi:hypothetical protein
MCMREMDDNFKASEKKWSGTASVWLLCRQKSDGVRVLMTAPAGNSRFGRCLRLRWTRQWPEM